MNALIGSAMSAKYPVQKTPYQIDKERRVQTFQSKVYGWTLQTCGACSGSGYYDTTDHRGKVPKCGNCSGTGKVRKPGPKALLSSCTA